MIASEKMIDAMRDGKLELHCVSVSITQKCVGGLCLRGYGVIRVNQVGTIYLEFICMEANNKPPSNVSGFHVSFPNDSLDKNQKLYLEANSLEGHKIFAEGFSLRISVFHMRAPYKIHVFINEVYFVEEDISKSDSKNYMYFELLEKPRIPTNKMNSESDSYGGESHTWNESDLQIEGATVNVINKENRVEVRVRGEFVADELYRSLLFYIGLSSGVMPQPYCVIKRVGSETVMHFKTVRNSLRGKAMPAPISDSVVGEGFPACHYAILASMLRVKRNNPLRFESAYSQWQRVWHSFQSENNISILTLAVAVEGLLNDVFIPELKLASSDGELETAKVALIDELGKLDVRDDHKQTLISSVVRWGNIHPGKALGILIDKGLVLRTEKKAWNDLRNSAAHPMFKENDNLNQLKEQWRISNTLTLFYRLVLNIFEYDGPMYEFRANEKPNFFKREYVRVLDVEYSGTCGGDNR
ncbi:MULTISPECIES: hypothetical protein [Pseudomonas fluorescens group]|uniref:hypothetical protein n=1 Tax=Pseudomonas fluorescens group TaxID=136843 RepID=UPI0008797B6C|nr:MULTISPECIES: hypothetical protein [Pseudomonas fluorescens group]SDU40412.1 hypothetical protein SAMN04490196_1951 [Pseudomonas moraviensis]